jgi:predicted RNA-binding protein with PIN domain
VLLEPYYDFRLELPADCVGRAMTDIQSMGGSVDAPEMEGDLTVLTGFAPVAGLRDYWQEVTAYTRGRGRLSCTVRGYEPCREQQRIVEEMGYDPERDADNPADSVFCSHGAGVNVKWNEVFDHMHVHSGIDLNPVEESVDSQPARRRSSGGSIEQDKELMAIFERTYGKVERKAFEPQRKPARTELSDKYNIREQFSGPEYLLVDGYNIIFAWEELAELARQDIAAARGVLTDILCNFRGYQKCELILVFDAYKVKGNPGSVEKRNNIHIVYTKEAQTADNYIERTTYELSKNHQVRVATSDGLEQVIILGHGAMRLSANAFRAEIEATRLQISQLIEQHNLRNRGNYKIRDVADLG